MVYSLYIINIILLGILTFNILIQEDKLSFYNKKYDFLRYNFLLTSNTLLDISITVLISFSMVISYYLY